MTSLPPNAPLPRFARIRKRSPDDEYGFNLHAEKTKGQFIGTVDVGSPAETAGLRPGDRIVAVNGVNVMKEIHKEVVRRIKENPLYCDLIVIDEDGLSWYTDRNIPIPIDQASLSENIPTEKLATSHSEKTTETIHETRHSVANDNNGIHSSVVSSATAAPRPPSYQEAIGTPESNNSLRPRLCTLIKPDLSSEFGFNLHVDKNKGHFIGKLDASSIAERAGLEEGHRIVGVNGVLITPETPHKEVVSLIKSNPLRAELLVASPEVDEWHKAHGHKFDFAAAERFVPLEHGIVSKGVANLTITNGYSTKVESANVNGERKENSVTVETNVVIADAKRAVEELKSSENQNSYSALNGRREKSLPPIEPYESIKDNMTTQERSSQQPDWMGLSAAQMRSLVAQRQKTDPRSKQITLQQKHELIRNM